MMQIEDSWLKILKREDKNISPETKQKPDFLHGQ